MVPFEQVYSAMLSAKLPGIGTCKHHWVP